jgi:hypothetical protein
MAASRGPLNYTTEVDPSRTAMDCISILSKHGASHVGLALGEDQQPDGIEFVIRTPWGPRGYSLPINTGGTHQVLQKARREHRIAPRYATPEHARRVAWRVLKDWLEAQMALIEAGAVDLPQVMLPYLRVDDKHTLYSAWMENEQRAIETAAGERPGGTG